MKRFALLLALACLPSYGGTNSFSTNSFSVTNNFVLNLWKGTNFLTISNRPWVNFGRGSVVVRVTDVEWNLITNRYPEKLDTNRLEFWK